MADAVRPAPEIWLVDDSTLVLRLIAAHCRRAGFAPLTFSEPTGFLHHFGATQTEPAAVVLDCDMPVMTGPEIIRLLRAGGFKPPMFLMSGTLTDRLRRDAAQAGAGAALDKAALRDVLPALLAALLRRAARSAA